MYGEGVSRMSSIVDMGVEMDIVDKSGAWFSYEGTRLGQGKENAKQALKDQPELAAEIEAKIRAKLLAADEPEPEAESDELVSLLAAAVEGMSDPAAHAEAA